MTIPRIHAFFAVSLRLSWSPLFFSIRTPFFPVSFIAAPVLFRVPRLSSCSSLDMFSYRVAQSRRHFDPIYDIYDSPLGPLTEQRCDGNGAGHQARRHGPEGDPATPVSLSQRASHAFPRGHYRHPRGRVRGDHHRTTNTHTTPRFLFLPFCFWLSQEAHCEVRVQVFTEFFS